MASYATVAREWLEGVVGWIAVAGFFVGLVWAWENWADEAVAYLWMAIGGIGPWALWGVKIWLVLAALSAVYLVLATPGRSRLLGEAQLVGRITALEDRCERMQSELDDLQTQIADRDDTDYTEGADAYYEDDDDFGVS